MINYFTTFSIAIQKVKQSAETTVTRASIDSAVLVLFFAKKVSEVPPMRPLSPSVLLGCIITETIIAIDDITNKTIIKVRICTPPVY